MNLLRRAQGWAAGERGDALIEAAVTTALVLAVGLGAFWVGNIVLRYHQLDSAVEAAARYGARSEVLPGGGASRRRTASEIKQFTIDAAAPLVLTAGDVEVLCGTSPTTLVACPSPETQPPGTYLQVKASSTVASSDPVMAFARATNGMLGVIGAGAPLPTSVTVSDASVAITE